MNWWSHQTEILPFFTLQLSFVAPPFHTQPQRRRLEQPMAVWKMRTLQSKMPIGNDTLCNHMSLFHDLFIQNISKLFKTNTIHYTSMHENTLTEACIDLHCFLMRAFFFYGYFQLPRSISHSLQPMYFLYDWVLSYVPTVWRGPASVPSTSPRICYQTVSSACDISKVPARDWKRPDSLAGEARKDPRSTQHKSSSFSFFRYRCAYVQPLLQVNKLLELPEEGTTSFSLKV